MRASAPLVLSALLLLPAVAPAQGKGGHDHDPGAATDPAVAAPARDPNLPAGEAAAKDELEHSPRHGEYQDVKLPDGSALNTWISYPERSDKAPVVVIIHEIFGLTDWIRALADQLARSGFIAVAPDLLSGLGPGGGGTSSFPGRDSVVAAIRRLKPATAAERLDAVRAWAKSLPAANGRSAAVGFCWGGSTCFAYAASRPDLDAAVVFYGSAPDSASLLKLRVPVLGLYGGDDARVNATIEPARRVLAGAKLRLYQHREFAGAGHGFLRQQDGRDGANLRATQEAWPLALSFLRAGFNAKPRR